MNNKKYKKGYTQGVFDMFHIGHLNLLNRAKEYCDILVVGVNSDQLVKEYKNKKPVIDQENRKIIIENIKSVDKVLIATTLDKVEIHKLVGFDVVFIGDDWKGNERWKSTEAELQKIGVDLFYLPYTEGICSSSLRTVEKNKIDD